MCRPLFRLRLLAGAFRNRNRLIPPMFDDFRFVEKANDGPWDCNVGIFLVELFEIGQKGGDGDGFGLDIVVLRIVLVAACAYRVSPTSAGAGTAVLQSQNHHAAFFFFLRGGGSCCVCAGYGELRSGQVGLGEENIKWNASLDRQ